MQLTQIDQERKRNLATLLTKARPDFEAVLPEILTPDRLIKTAITAATRTPELLKCDQASFLQAIMTSAELGLEPGSTLGLFYLIPFNNKKRGTMEVQAIVGYKGLINLALRNPAITSIRSRVVFREDDFSVEYGLSERVSHRPKLEGDPGPMIGVYAVATLRDGGTVFEWMPKAQVDAVRRRARASDSGPWVTDYDQMARKTVIRRLANYLPLSPELGRAIEIESDLGSEDDTTPPSSGKSRARDLAESLAERRKGASEAEIVPEARNGSTPPLVAATGTRERTKPVDIPKPDPVEDAIEVDGWEETEIDLETGELFEDKGSVESFQESAAASGLGENGESEIEIEEVEEAESSPKRGGGGGYGLTVERDMGPTEAEVARRRTRGGDAPGVPPAAIERDVRSLEADFARVGISLRDLERLYRQRVDKWGPGAIKSLRARFNDLSVGRDPREIWKDFDKVKPGWSGGPGPVENPAPESSSGAVAEDRGDDPGPDPLDDPSGDEVGGDSSDQGGAEETLQGAESRPDWLVRYPALTLEAQRLLYRAEGFNIDWRRIEAKLNKPLDELTEADIARLNARIDQLQGKPLATEAA